MSRVNFGPFPLPPTPETAKQQENERRQARKKGGKLSGCFGFFTVFI